MPLANIKLCLAQNATCYNGYITEMTHCETKEQFVENCLRHEEVRRSKPPRKARIRRLARDAWDYWLF